MTQHAALIRRDYATTPSYCMPLEAPVVTLRLLEHLPEGALPLARLLVLLLDPQSHLHHAPRDVPVAPQRLNRLVVIARTRCLVEQWSPRVLVLADELDLLEGVLGFPLLHLLPDLANRGLRGYRHCEHPHRREDLDLGHVVRVALGDLRGALLDQAALLVPDFPVGGGVLRKNDLLPLLLCHRSGVPALAAARGPLAGAWWPPRTEAA
mmetsp:Transcript_105621/g.286708  ORF Transcript_105621/g.286708 Transcript_105621/m.286708 type:complete len:209 (+) Transcript_105621:97-723(+)